MLRDGHGYPVIPHELAGDKDCEGQLLVQMRGDQADLECGACGEFIRSVPASEVEAFLAFMRAGETCSHRCPYCQAVNSLLGVSGTMAYICPECGEGVRTSADEIEPKPIRLTL